MWSLVCTWTEPPGVAGRDELARRVADTARAVHLLAGRAPLWQDWAGDRVRTVYDAGRDGGHGSGHGSGYGSARDGATAGLVEALARAGTSELGLHSVIGDDLDGPSSTLWLQVGDGRTGVLEWAPLDLADRVLGEPAVARALLVSVAGIWDADAAAWSRSEVDALRGSTAPTGWMTYRAGVDRAAVPGPVRPALRGVLAGPPCPAADYGPQHASGARSVLAG